MTIKWTRVDDEMDLAFMGNVEVGFVQIRGWSWWSNPSLPDFEGWSGETSHRTRAAAKRALTSAVADWIKAAGLRQGDAE